MDCVDLGSGPPDLAAPCDDLLEPTPDLAAMQDCEEAPPGTADLATQADLAFLPQGTRIATADRLYSITTDDQVILTSAADLLAVPASGGVQPVVIDTNVTHQAISATIVFTWQTDQPRVGVGPAHAWTAAGGSHAVASRSFGGLAAASDDGRYIALTDGALDDTADMAAPFGRRWTVDVVSARVDGTGRTTIAQSKVADLRGPMLQFAGGRLFVEPWNGDASPTDLYAADPALGKVTVLMQDIAFERLSIDRAGERAFVVDAGGGAWVVSAVGQAAIAIDTGVAEGWILPDGSAVLYRTINGALKRAPVAPKPVPLLLVAGGVNALQYTQDLTFDRDWSLVGPALSTDGRWLLFSSQGGAVNTFDHQQDLFLASTTIPGAPRTLEARPVAGILGDAFTRDSSQVLYHAPVRYFGSVDAGDFFTVTVANGMPVRWSALSGLSRAATGSRVVFTDNIAESCSDLAFVDAAGPGPATRIAANVAPAFVLTRSRGTVVYELSSHCTGGGNASGIYAYPIP